MKLFETHHKFSVPWDTLTLANWRKYPNDISNHVLSVDVLERKIDPFTGFLRTERLLVCKQNAPSILKTLGIPIQETAYFREISELDPKSQKFTATTINLTLTNILTVEETCIFERNPDDLESSLFTQKGHVVAVAALSYLGRLVEEAAVSRFYANSRRGRDGLQLVIDKISEEYEEMKKTIEQEIGNAAMTIEREFDNAAISLEKMTIQASQSIEHAALESFEQASSSLETAKNSLEKATVQSLDTVTKISKQSINQARSTLESSSHTRHTLYNCANLF